MDDPSSLPRVLIVDDSRIVRASIVKHIKGSYDYREEANGEAGWQTLVLDSTIEIVVSDISMPKLDGFGLLERVRNSRLARLRELPFVMISGDEDESVRARAKARGVSDFIGKGIGAAELLARLDSLRDLSRVRRDLEASRQELTQAPESGLFTRRYLELQAAQALSQAARHHNEVSVLALGFDGLDALQATYGDEAVVKIQHGFAKMLGTKIRHEDSLGHYDPQSFAIVSPATSESGARAFAARLMESVAAANVTAEGRRVELSVSIGLANSPADEVHSAAALLERAAERMRLAMQQGGDRVFGREGAVAPAPSGPTLVAALDALRGGRGEALRPHIGAIGRQLSPLLAFLDAELKLGLPLAEIERRLNDRARSEEDARQQKL